MSLYPTLEDMEVSNMAQTQLAAESAMQQQAIAVAGGGQGMDIVSAGGLYPSLDTWMGMDQKTMQQYIKPEMAGTVSPVTGPSNQGMAAADIQKGVRQVIACKDPKSHRVGMAVENINKGIFVSYVESGGVAAKAGLRFGDQILQINGEHVAGWSISKTIDFLKKADPQSIKFAVRDRPFERTVTCVKDSSGHVGFQFKKGKINAIVKDSSAARNGMLTDHYICEIDGQNVVGLSDEKLLKIIKERDRTITITVMPEFVYDHMIKHLGHSLRKNMDRTNPADM